MLHLLHQKLTDTSLKYRTVSFKKIKNMKNKIGAMLQGMAVAFFATGSHFFLS
jgi:hypothetical protein